jgi:hypothetical protein
MANVGSSRGPQHTLVKGRSSAGPITLPPVKAGDRVIDMANIASLGSEASNFETSISVSGQIQQVSASDLSAREYWAITLG